MEPKALLILNQVRSLYRRYGIKSVTMDDVAAHLNISKKTLYEHFSNKEDLVAHVLLFEEDNRRAMLMGIGACNYNAIEEFFEVYRMIHAGLREYNHSMEFDVRKYYPELYTKVRKMRRRHIYVSAYRNLEKGKKEGLYRSELNSGIIARVHVFRTENIFENDIFSIREVSSSMVFQEIFVYHLQGILSHQGRNFLERNSGKFRITAG